MKTEARILWDDEALYVFMKAYDKDITAYRTERDSDTRNDDVLELFLVPERPETLSLTSTSKSTPWELSRRVRLQQKPYRRQALAILERRQTRACSQNPRDAQ